MMETILDQVYFSVDCNTEQALNQRHLFLAYVDHIFMFT